jgi:hypothetical protein
MTNRSVLPARRTHETFDFEHNGRLFTAGLGRARPNGPVQEVFLNSGKSGTDAETLARDSSVLLSIALQYGVPLQVMAHAVTRNVDGTPSGPIGKLLDLMVAEQ